MCPILSYQNIATLMPVYYLSSIPDLPCSPGFNNNLDGGDCLQWWTPRDDLVAG